MSERLLPDGDTMYKALVDRDPDFDGLFYTGVTTTGGVIGSFFMVDAVDRGQVEKFQRNDPLLKSGIWASTDVRAFTKRVDNRG